MTGDNPIADIYDFEASRQAVTGVKFNVGYDGYANQNVQAGNAGHSHSITTNAANATHGHNLSINAQNADHQHTITVGSAGNVNNMDFRVQYIDVIVCRKD